MLFTVLEILSRIISTVENGVYYSLFTIAVNVKRQPNTVKQIVIVLYEAKYLSREFENTFRAN